jgi:hypothetical protein
MNFKEQASMPARFTAKKIHPITLQLRDELGLALIKFVDCLGGNQPRPFV